MRAECEPFGPNLDAQPDPHPHPRPTLGEEGWDLVGEFRGSQTYVARSSAAGETGTMTCRITGEMPRT